MKCLVKYLLFSFFVLDNLLFIKLYFYLII